MNALQRGFFLCLLLPFVMAAQDAGMRIQLDGVPLTDAIRNLARQADLNYILDPRVPGAQANNAAAQPSVTASWTNATVETVFQWILRQHQLAAVTNPATRITRIAPAKAGIDPVPPNLIRTNNTNVIALLNFESVPMADAIQQLCGGAEIKAALDPKVTAELARAGTTLTARWQNVTAAQALAAVLDNHNLTLADGASGSLAVVRFKNRRPTETR